MIKNIVKLNYENIKMIYCKIEKLTSIVRLISKKVLNSYSEFCINLSQANFMIIFLRIYSSNLIDLRLLSQTYIKTNDINLKNKNNKENQWFKNKISNLI